MHFALKEIRKIIHVAIPENSNVLYGPSHAKELVESLLPAKSWVITGAKVTPMPTPTHVLMLSLTDEMNDIYNELTNLRTDLNSSTRIYVVTMSRMWSRMRNRIYGLPRNSNINNWIPPNEISNIFEQTGFEIVHQRSAVLCPFRIPLISQLANRWLSQMPILRHFSLFNIITIRPKLRDLNRGSKVSVIVAARNLSVGVGVDNTFATPLIQNPLAMGADIVMHSVTKYFAGHSDVIMGSLSTKMPELHSRLHEIRKIHGGIPGPYEAWLALRGLRTFPLRFQKAQENALELAKRLSKHPGVSRVRYPGLPQDSQA